MLAKYLEKWPEIVAGKTCIELGAGCGLAGGHFYLEFQVHAWSKYILSYHTTGLVG